MYYVFHGDEEYLRSQEVARLRSQVAEDGMGDLNITTIDGRRITLSDIINACNTLPFLTQRRLVIIDNLLQRFESRRKGRSASADMGDGEDESGASLSEADKAFAKELCSYLPTMPETTRLLFVDDRPLKRSNPVLKAANKQEEGFAKEFRSPSAESLPKWLAAQARTKGTSIERNAAALLASFVGQDLRRLDNELEKLAALAGYERAITTDDVRELVGEAQEARIFTLVDALGMRSGQHAMRELQTLFATNASELYVLAMVARQIRLILSVKDMDESDGLSPVAIRKALHISHGFIVDKLLRQARQFESEELRTILGRVLEIDQSIKTGRIDGTLALEMLVLEICHSRGHSSGASSYQGRSRSRTA